VDGMCPLTEKFLNFLIEMACSDVLWCSVVKFIMSAIRGPKVHFVSARTICRSPTTNRVVITRRVVPCTVQTYSGSGIFMIL